MAGKWDYIARLKKHQVWDAATEEERKKILDLAERAAQAGWDMDRYLIQASKLVKGIAQPPAEGTPTPTPTPEPEPTPTPEIPEGTLSPEDIADASATLEEILAVYGVPAGLFRDLIRQAVIESWGSAYLLSQIAKTPEFDALFPGLDGLMTEGYSLTGAIQHYGTMKRSYFGVMKDLGAEGLFALDARTIGMLVGNGVSPEELAMRVTGLKKYKENPEYAAFLDAQAQQAGLGPVGVAGTIEFLAGLGDPDLFDLIEGAEIMQYGSLDAETAHKLARALGKPGEMGNVIDLTDVLASWNDKAMSELRSAGISQEQLVRGALQPQFQGTEREKANADFLAVQQVLRNRQARLQAVPQIATQLTRGRPVTQGDALLQSI